MCTTKPFSKLFFHENAFFWKKVAQKFGHIKKKQYLCTRFWKRVIFHTSTPLYWGPRHNLQKLWWGEEEVRQLHKLRSNAVIDCRFRRGAVVQLVRIPACHAVGREFESRPHRKCWKSTSYAWDALKSAQNLHKWLSLMWRSFAVYKT